MIREIGLLIVWDNRILLCRKSSGTSLSILPGRKLEGEEAMTFPILQ